MRHLVHLLAAVALVLPLSGTAVASPGRLSVAVDHAPSHVLPGMVAGRLSVAVAASSGGPVTVTATMPAGLTATAAGGRGWTCGTPTTCTHESAPYPPLTIIVDVAADVPPSVQVTVTATAGARTATTVDTIPARDACTYGWSAGEPVTFDHFDSGVPDPSRADGCTLLDEIWAAGPFASHAQFVSTVMTVTSSFVHSGLLTHRQQRAVVTAAARSSVGSRPEFDNSCANRVALKFDDGISSFRPRLLELLRHKQVNATFFDNGVRVAANPAVAQFQVREGHVQLNHTYLHVHLDQLPPAAIRDEILRTRRALAAAGAPETFAGIRPPFGDTNDVVRRVLLELGYTEFVGEWQAEAEDWLPERTATEIADAIVTQLRAGVVIGLHDGPIDTTSGAATVEAVGLIIDRARAQGFCFGVPGESGHVVASRYVSSNRPIPPVTHPVPYLMPLAFGEVADLPRPFTRIPSPLRIKATHAPATFRRGSTGNTLTLTVTNESGHPTDGAEVAITSPAPTGLTVTAVSGNGWTCTTEGTCTRTDVLPPRSSYPPITLTVTVAADAPATVLNAPALRAHAGSWTDEFEDRIPVSDS